MKLGRSELANVRRPLVGFYDVTNESDMEGNSRSASGAPKESEVLRNLMLRYLAQLSKMLLRWIDEKNAALPWRQQWRHCFLPLPLRAWSGPSDEMYSDKLDSYRSLAILSSAFETDVLQ